MHKILSTLKLWFKDLFYDSNNEHLDNGRVIAFAALSLLAVAVEHNMKLKLEIHLDQLGQGLGVVLTALVVYVWHDRKQNAA